MKKVLSVLAVGTMLSVSAYCADVLAIVNGANITTEVAPKNFTTLEKDVQKQIVDKLIEKKLASDFAMASGVMEKEEYIKALEHVLQMSSGEKKKDEANLADMLKKDEIKGYTKEQLESKKGLLAFDFLLDEKAKTMEPDEKTLKEFYESRKFMYDTPALIELLTIVVSDEKLANEIVSKLQKAQDPLSEFSNLAKAHSLAPSRDNHGYFGKIPVNELNADLKPVLGNLKRGQFTTKPVKNEFGYEVFYVLNDIPEFVSSFDEVKSRIKDEYVQKEVKNWAINKIKELKEKAQIKILL